MKKILLALSLAVLLATPSHAALRTAQATSIYNSGSLVNANDAVSLAVHGEEWGSAAWSVITAGSGGITTEYTTEVAGVSAVNWLPAPYSIRTDVQTANRSTSPWANNGPVVGTFETPLPGNCTAFRIRYQTAGTPTTITLSGGAPYVPGVPVVATLYDVTSGVNAALDTGVLDMSGWASLLVAVNMLGTTPSSAILAVFVGDNGADIIGAIGGTTTGTGYIGIGPGSSSASIGSGGLAQGFSGAPPRRLHVTASAPGAAANTHLILYARR